MEKAKRRISWVMAILGVVIAVFDLGLMLAGLGGDRIKYTLPPVLWCIVIIWAASLQFKRPGWAGVAWLAVSPVTFACLARWYGLYFGATGALFSGEQIFWNGVRNAVLFSLALIPALFWLRAAWRKWPALFPGRLSKRGIAIATASVFVATVCSLGMSLVFYLQPHYQGDCGRTASPFSKPIRDGHVVFTGKIIHASAFGLVVKVQEHFGGLSPLNPWIAFIGGDILRDPRFVGQTWFFDAGEAYSWIPALFSAVELRNCGRTMQIEAAGPDLRLLRDGPKPGVRIIGQVTRRYDNWETPPNPNVVGEKVYVNGPDGEFILTTDKEGIYDKVGLPTGTYSIKIKSAGVRRDGKPYDNSCDAYLPRKEYWDDGKHAFSGEIWGCTLHIPVGR